MPILLQKFQILFTKSMNQIKIFIAIIASLGSACSTQSSRNPDSTALEPVVKTQPQQEKQPDNYTAANPPLTVIKDGKKLNLVRVMDGGICKNELQGASGSFLVYANPQDIERIKHEKPKEIFKDFETKIQNFSAMILEHAISQTNLAVDPFSLGDDVMQEKLAAQLTKNFRNAASQPLAAFARETTLTVDIMPFSPSLIFYQNGCSLGQLEP
jgi:hypothetical protein